jgi:transcriptional regulator with XRE-family HTH domain
MPVEGSIVARRQLGRELRSWREQAGRTREDVAAAQVASVPKLLRIEHGLVTIRPADTRELCRLYGVDPAQTEALVELAWATRNEEWWESADARAPRWFGMYLRLAAVAHRMLTFQPTLVHGLFQTEAYAREVERLTVPDTAAETVDAHVTARMDHQRRILDRSEPLRIHLVLGEPALLTRLAPTGLMDAQLQQLHELDRRPAVEVRILPLTAGLHPGVNGAFTIMDFDDPRDPPVAYVESYEAARYPEKPAQVARYRRRFRALHGMSVPLQEYAP